MKNARYNPSAWAALVLAAAFALVPTGAAQIRIDVNRPQSAFDCDTPRGEQWYGSTERCLDELCGGENVFNEYIFDAKNRRRLNPCYGRSPTEFGE
jgi:hypothetical protein